MVARTKATSTAGASSKHSPKKFVVSFPVSDTAAGGEQQQGQAHLLKSMIDDMVADPSHILPMYTHLQGRKASLASASTVAQNAPRFESLSTFSSADDDYKGSWITANSDLSAGDLVAAVKADPAAIDNLMTFACQVAPKQKLPSEFQTKEVFTRFLNARHEEAGSRLKNFKGKSGINNDGSLNFRAASYSLSFDKEGRLHGIKHFSGEKATVDISIGITDAWTLASNFDDMAATICRPPLPPLRLATFFGDREGPHKITNYFGKPKALATRASELFQAWERDELVAKARVTPAVAVKAALDEHRKQKSQAAMDKARAAAKVALQRKRERLTIKLKA